MTQKAAARHFQAIANDNFKVGCSEWRHAGEANGRNVVIIAPATSVKAEYYHRFAGFLFENGSDVVTFDYRGIGASRPPDMRAVEASYVDWGRRDLEAVLRYVAERYPGQPIDVVAHSIGGFAVGLAPSSHLVRRVLTVGAQFAYWKDYAPHKRLQMVLRWHLFMPLRRAAVRLLSRPPARLDRRHAARHRQAMEHLPPQLREKAVESTPFRPLHSQAVRTVPRRHAGDQHCR
jgi:predicted alpha/beta hydrolase